MQTRIDSVPGVAHRTGPHVRVHEMDFGEYSVLYTLDYDDEGLLRCSDIVGYEINGKPIEAAELAKDFILRKEADVDEGLGVWE